MNWPLAAWILITLFTFIAPTLSRAAAEPGDQLDQSLRAFAGHDDRAVVAAVIDANGLRIFHYGNLNGKQSPPADAGTVFEIGSLTKVFTSLILADMVQHGEVSLDDPISKYLPPNARLHIKGREITLRDLATHVSSLPRLPKNLSPADPQNPYADYSVENLYAFLRDFTPANAPGEKFEYSNLAVGLLGHILSLRAKTNYESLVSERVCRPLGMTNTVMTLTPELRASLAIGHDVSGKLAANWDIPTLAGAGALRSTVNDLAKLAAAAAGLTKTPLDAAIAFTQQTQTNRAEPATKTGLAWMKLTMYGTDLVWHNGGTGGYRSFLGCDPEHHRAVVILSSSAEDNDKFGIQALTTPLAAAHAKDKKEHTAIAMDDQTFDAYVGEYALAPGVTLAFKREGAHFYTRLTGQSFLEIFPESKTDFFLKVVDAQLTFIKDASGKPTAVILHQNGTDQKAARLP